MTIAEKTATRKRRIEELCKQIREILTEKPNPLDLSAIEVYLKQDRLHRGEPYEDLSTFDVRDAVSELVKSGAARYVLGSEVALGAGQSNQP